MVVNNNIQLHVEGDLSRFMNNTKYSGSVNFSLGGQNSFTDQRNYTCSALVLAQRSGVLENLICCGTQEIPLDKDLFSLGDHRSIADCIKICYGGSVKFTVDNIATIVKFAALYQIEGMLDSASKWLKGNCSPQTVVAWFHLGVLLEKEFRNSSLITFFKDYLSLNTLATVHVLLDCVQCENKELSHILLEVARLTNEPSIVLMGLLEQWIKQSQSNRKFILKNAKIISFQPICPDQAVFKKFTDALQQGDQSIVTTDIIKDIKSKYSNTSRMEKKTDIPPANPFPCANVSEFTSDPHKAPQHLRQYHYQPSAQLVPNYHPSATSQASGSNSSNSSLKGTEYSNSKPPNAQKFKLFYSLTHLRGGEITLDSILNKFNVNAGVTHGYNEYQYIETCLEWITFSVNKDGFAPSEDDGRRVCRTFKIFDVGYSYISSVWDHMADKKGPVVLKPLPASNRWNKKSGKPIYWDISRDLISTLGQGESIALEIPEADSDNLCKRSGCNIKVSGPHKVIIQLREKPPLLLVDDTIYGRSYHTHPGFIEHCYGWTTTASGKNEIISLVTTNREEFVNAMHERKFRQICIVSAGI